MYQLLSQINTTVQLVLSSLLDHYELVISPVFRPLLRTSQPRPGLAMQRIPLPGQPAFYQVPQSPATYTGRVDR